MNISDAIFLQILYFTVTSFLVGLIVGAVLLALEEIYLRRQVNIGLFRRWYWQRLTCLPLEEWRLPKPHDLYAEVKDVERANAFELPYRQLVAFLGNLTPPADRPESVARLTDWLITFGKYSLAGNDHWRQKPPSEDTIKPATPLSDDQLSEAPIIEERRLDAMYMDRALDDAQAFFERGWILERYKNAAIIVAIFYVSIMSRGYYVGERRITFDGVLGVSFLYLFALAAAALFAPFFRDLLQRISGRGPV